jgi:hypothetical protein
MANHRHRSAAVARRRLQRSSLVTRMHQVFSRVPRDLALILFGKATAGDFMCWRSILTVPFGTCRRHLQTRWIRTTSERSG